MSPRMPAAFAAMLWYAAPPQGEATLRPLGGVGALQGEVAGGDVSGGERAQLRLLLRAQVLRERAPGTESAAGRRGDRAGQFTLDPRALPRPRLLRIRDRDRRDEPGRVGVRR